LSLTCHSINSSTGSTLSTCSLPVNDVIIDTVQTLRELSSVCMEEESKESHLQLLRGGFEGLRSAIFPVQGEQRAYHILPKELIRLCNTELYSYLDSLSRSKAPIAEDVYCHSILIFPTILSRADISQTGECMYTCIHVCMYLEGFRKLYLYFCLLCRFAPLSCHCNVLDRGFHLVLALHQLLSLNRSI
jgi:hypothetical protein